MSRRCFTTPTNPCPSYPNSSCIVYTGSNLTCAGIRTNDRLDAILLKIDTKLCTLGGGTTYITEGDGINITGAGTSGNPYTVSIIDPYTDEKAQDAVGGILSNEFSYDDNTPLISINQIDWSKIINVPPSASVNIYTSDGTIGENRTVDLDNKQITWDNNNLFFIRDDSGVGEYTFSNGLLFENADSTNSYKITQNLADGVKIGWNNIPNTSAINLNVLSTGIFANGLTNLTSQTRLIGQDGTTNKLGYITVSGNDLAISGGALTFIGAGNYIQNQFTGAQSLSNYWISGNARINGYTQISTAGRIVEHNGTVSVTDSASVNSGANLRIRKLLFYTDNVPTNSSLCEIFSHGNDRLTIKAPGNLTFNAPVWTIDNFTQLSPGNKRPFIIGGLTANSAAANELDILNIYNQGDNTVVGLGARSLIGFSGNITTTGRVPVVRIGSELINSGTSTYQGDFVVYTANAANPSERMRVRYDGNVYIKTLDTDLVAPTTTGTTKMVICDSTGLLSFTDVVGGGEGTVTSFSAGDLSPLFTTSEATTTTTPALTFALNTQTANTLFAGPISGSAAAPTFRAMVAEDVAANSGHYIQNQTASQTANFFVSGYSSVGTPSISTRKFSVGESALAIADADRRVLDISFGATFNTTASAISSYSINATNTSSRTSGSNALTNIGLYASATTGQVNYSAYFDAGDILMASLANTSTQNRLIGQDSATGIIDYVTIGTGLSLSSGSLSATVSALQSLQSTITVSPLLTGANTINSGGFDFGVENMDDFTLENSGSLFLKVANHVAATTGDVLTLVNTTTGEMTWAANGAGTGGTVTNFTAGTLSPLFTTSVATATSTPALSFILSTQTANTGFYGPVSGGSAAPIFRAMVAADVASGSGNYIQNQIAGVQSTSNFHISDSSAIGAAYSSAIKLYVTDGATASAVNRTGVSSGMASTYNTTSGVLTSTSINASNTSSRSSGSNNLTNIGMYATASGAQLNYSAYFDNGDILMNDLINTSTQDRIVGQTASTKIIDYIIVGSGLSLISGVLAATSAGAQNLQSVMTVGSTLTTNNVINSGGFNFELSSAANLTLGNTGTFFMKVANFGAATVGDVLTLQSTSTGAVAWAANGAGTGGTVTSFSAGDLSPLFTTSETTVTSTPALAFALTNAAANTYFGNSTGSTAAPSYTTAGSLTGVDDTNVTLTLGGNPTTSLLRSASLTLGWTGTLAVARGGTALSTLGTASQLLRVNAGATALEYFTSTFISANQTITLSGDVTGTGTTAITTTIPNNTVTYAKMQDVAVTKRVLGRNTAAAGDAEEVTITQLLDWAGTAAQGNILYRNASAWVLLAPGISGQALTTAGAAANPQWSTLVTSFSAGDLAPLFTTSEATVTSTPALTFALTNAAANTYFGNATGSTAAPSYTAAGALTKVDDTNVTLTLGGNPTTSLLRAVSITAGWTGTLAIARGGTGLSSIGTANQLLRVNAGVTALEYFTPTFLTTNQTITLSGDVTGSGTTAITTTIANDAVTNAKMANIVASRIKGRITASTGDPEDMTGTQATTLLDVFTSALKGVAPASGGGTTNFLRADGTWTTPAGGGSVTSIDITAPAAGITASGGPITTAGSITLALADDLAAIEALSTTGIVRRTGTSTWTAGGVVTIAEGGTALTSTPTNGQFLIGNGTGYTLAALTGTTNQVTVTGGAGSSTLSLPQNIHTLATPQFTRIGLGTAASTAYGANIGGSGHTIAALGVVASTSAQAGADAYVALVAGTIVEAASGTHSMLSALALSPAIITPGAATVTRTATLYVSGASSATVTTANDAIYSASGNNRFAGDIIAGANNVNSTNNYDVVVRNQSTGRVETVGSDLTPVNVQTGLTYTLVLTDKGKAIERSNASANTLTIPTNASVAFPLYTTIVGFSSGAGQTTINGAGVTLNASDGALKTRVQFSSFTLIKTGTNIWWIGGDLTT